MLNVVTRSRALLSGESEKSKRFHLRNVRTFYPQILRKSQKRNPRESERELPRVVNAADVSLKTTMHNPESLRVFALIDWM